MMKKSNKELESITITSPNYLTSEVTTGQTDATEQIKHFSAQMHAIKIRGTSEAPNLALVKNEAI